MNWNDDFLIAKKMLSKGLFHAASSIFVRLEENISLQSDMNKRGELFDEQGKIYLSKFPNYKKAVEYFTRAIESTEIKDARVRYTVHLGMAYRKMSEFDTCYRYFTNLIEDLTDVSAQTKGMLFANLSAIQGINGFYDQAIVSTERSMNVFADANTPLKESILDNNKGLAYLELRLYDKAEYHLKRAMELGGRDFIEPLTELGRVCLYQNRIEDSIQYAEQALDVIWASIITDNKEEIARLCSLLANISVGASEVDLAMSLAEKAQLLFGKLGMWRQWQNIESQLEQWSIEPPKPYDENDRKRVSLDRVRNFLQCLEAINVQELIHANISDLLDVRVYYAQIFSRELNLSKEDQDDLVLASRFADYGLTALESEVVMNPTRSPMAFEQYKQHPSLSVSMVKALSLSDRISEIILDHHEHYDGSGYPSGKKAGEISYLSRVLSIVDHYAMGVVINRRNHFDLRDDIKQKSGTVFDPVLVDVFLNM